jgi:hypothetical protein
MNLSNTFLVAAVTGILSGAVGCAGNQPAPIDPTATASTAGGAAQPVEKHGCKGQNSCKGNGGCKTAAHSCKGQNACKGQGGCKTA